MANGKPTAGIVLAFFSLPASLCFSAAVVVDGAVPDKGCTYDTKFWPIVRLQKIISTATIVIFFR